MGRFDFFLKLVHWGCNWLNSNCMPVRKFGYASVFLLQAWFVELVPTSHPCGSASSCTHVDQIMGLTARADEIITPCSNSFCSVISGARHRFGHKCLLPWRKKRSELTL